MARIEPLRALHYDQAVAGPLQDLAAPPYDVLDDAARAQLAGRSPYNVVHVDLPRPDGSGETDPYAHAAALLDRWRAEGALVRDGEPALWPLRQEYTGPDGERRIREGFLARVRVEPYGAGRIRAHERTHPGPKEDRLRLTRATRANLSPIFALFSDPAGATRAALARATAGPADGTWRDDEGTVHHVWRAAEPAAIEAVQQALEPAELLIADGHHRYETARVHADEIGGEGDHRYVLMCLVPLEDPGLTVFPTHRLVRTTTAQQQEALAATIRERFAVEEVALDDLAPPAGDGPLQLGYVDAHFRRGFRLTLEDPGAATAVLPGPLARLDTALLETLLLKGPLELTDDDISHQTRLGYARTAGEAVDAVRDGHADLAFVLRPSPVEQVREIAAAGATMPPKSTYFFPKVPTGLLFNPLDDRE